MHHQEVDLTPFKFDDFPSGRFFHFLMGKAKLVEGLVSQCPTDEAVFIVTYDHPYRPPASEARRIRSFHYRNSTVHQGYNLGWRVSMMNAERFDYFCSLDDDVNFARGTYRDFLSAVLQVEPFIAVPMVERTAKEKFQVPNASLQAGAIHDQQIMVFDKSTLRDPDVWPFVESVHQVSSFVAPIIQEYFIHENHPQKVAQFNDFFVENNGHVWEKPDPYTTYSVPHKGWDVPRDAAHNYIREKTGKPPRVDNDIFLRVRTNFVSDFTRKKYWNAVGRKKFMRRLITQRGEIKVT